MSAVGQRKNGVNPLVAIPILLFIGLLGAAAYLLMGGEIPDNIPFIPKGQDNYIEVAKIELLNAEKEVVKVVKPSMLGSSFTYSGTDYKYIRPVVDYTFRFYDSNTQPDNLRFNVYYYVMDEEYNNVAMIPETYEGIDDYIDFSLQWNYWTMDAPSSSDDSPDYKDWEISAEDIAMGEISASNNFWNAWEGQTVHVWAYAEFENQYALDYYRDTGRMGENDNAIGFEMLTVDITGTAPPATSFSQAKFYFYGGLHGSGFTQ